MDVLRTIRSPDSKVEDYVFCHKDGTPIHPQVLSDAFKRLVGQSGLPRIRLHDLRHTHATLLLKAGVHIKVVSERLGHSTPGFTMATCQHCPTWNAGRSSEDLCRTARTSCKRSAVGEERFQVSFPRFSPVERAKGDQSRDRFESVTRLSEWRGEDLNLRPSGYEPDELPDCSTPRRRRHLTWTEGLPPRALRPPFRHRPTSALDASTATASGPSAEAAAGRTGRPPSGAGAGQVPPTRRRRALPSGRPRPTRAPA